MQVPTSCQLLVRRVRSDGAEEIEKASWGLVHPPSERQVVHNSALIPGYVKVSVDDVRDEFHGYMLPDAPNDEMITLYDAKGSFIQWPKYDILIDNPRPTNTISPDLPPTLTPMITEPSIRTSSESELMISTPMSGVDKTSPNQVIVVEKPIQPSNEPKQAPPSKEAGTTIAVHVHNPCTPNETSQPSQAAPSKEAGTRKAVHVSKPCTPIITASVATKTTSTNGVILSNKPIELTNQTPQPSQAARPPKSGKTTRVVVVNRQRPWVGLCWGRWTLMAPGRDYA